MDTNNYDELSQEQQQLVQENPNIQEIMEYILMRDEFISPVYFPQVGYAFLRSDFNFAQYLCRSLAFGFQIMFKISRSSLVVTLAFVYIGIWLCVLDKPILSVHFNNLNYIKEQITQNAENPSEIIFLNENKEIYDPVPSSNLIYCPKYLKRFELNDEQNENNEDDDNNFVRKRAMPNEMKIANLHEELFIFRNPSFTQKLINFNILIMVCWILTNSIWAIQFFSDSKHSKQILYLILVGFFLFCCLLAVLSLLYLIPLMQIKFSIFSNIQMLRNKERIEKVVFHQKAQKALLIQKFYRLLKQYQNENRNEDEEQQQLPNITEEIKNLIDENYKIITQTTQRDQNNNEDNNDNENNNQSIELMPIDRLSKFVHLCGNDIDLDEQIYFSRLLENEQLTKEQLMQAIQQLQANSSLDPFITSKKILSEIANKEFITKKQLEKTIRYCKLLSEYECSQLMNEFYYITKGDDQDQQYIEINTLACLIRDSIEGLPR